jgi:tetratricopeptide (TPR) repeat protein
VEEEMQVKLAISKRSGQRADYVCVSASRFLLSLTFILICCSLPAQAQKDSTSKPAAAASGEMGAATTPNEQTRSRRIVESPGASASKSATTGNETAENVSESSADDPPLTIGGDRLSALRAQLEAAKTDRERSRLQRMLIDYLVALGKKHEAVAELRIMSRAERLDPIGFYNIGNALARLGDTDTAIDAYRKAIEQRHGNYARAFHNLGVMFFRQGRWDEAQESLATALRLENFRYSEASYNLGRVYAARGEADLGQ